MFLLFGFSPTLEKKKGNCDFCFGKHGLKDILVYNVQCMLCNVVWHQGFIMNLKCQSILWYFVSIFCYYKNLNNSLYEKS